MEYLRGLVNGKQVEALEIRRKTTEFYKQQKELSLKKEAFLKSTYVDKLHKNAKVLQIELTKF